MKRFIPDLIVVLLLTVYVACTTERESVTAPTEDRYTSQQVPAGLLTDMWSLAGFLYEPHDNWWNLRVDKAPLEPTSDAIIAKIKSYDHHYIHPDFAVNYGIPYCVVTAETPRVPVNIEVADESDHGWNGVPGYPIPEAAKTNPRYFENGNSGEGDGHLIIFDKDQRVAYELAYTSWNGSQWIARYGAIFDLNTNYRRPEGWTSTDAAGLCVLAGLVRYDELYGIWPIRHAIRCSIRRTNVYVWPASHTGARDSGAPPLGMRFRLKPTFDIKAFLDARDLEPIDYRAMSKLLNAMKDYGMIVADRGGNMYIQGTMDARWDNGVLNPVLHALDADDFEVIQLGWNP